MALSRFLAGIRRGGTSHLERELESLRSELKRVHEKVARMADLDDRLTRLEQQVAERPASSSPTAPDAALQDLKDEIDECRRDNLRIAELYDLTLERLGAPSR